MIHVVVINVHESIMYSATLGKHLLNIIFPDRVHLVLLAPEVLRAPAEPV